MNNLAPVAVFAFNRPEPLRLVLERLSTAEKVDDRVIYVYVDGARSENDAPKIEAVVEVIEEIRLKRLRNIIVRHRKKNLGCQKNISSAITEVLREHDRIIVVEDDVLVSKTFLAYMDEALELYAGDNRIWGINGHQCPYLFLPIGFKDDVYLSPRNLCTGWATWRNRWEQVDFEIKDWPEFIREQRNVDRLTAAGNDIRRMLEMHYDGKLNSWALPCTYYMVKHGMFVVEPRHSLTKNVGFGLESVHCGNVEMVWGHQKYYNFRPNLKKDIEPNMLVLKRFRYVYNDPRLFWRIVRKLFRVYKGITPIHNNPIDV